MNPIVFLDIDGVLNHENYYEDRYNKIKSGEWAKVRPPISDTEYWKALCEKRGVLYETFMTKHKSYTGDSYYHPFYEELGDIDQNSVEILNKFTEEVDAKIVVSSSWRFSGLEWMQTILKLAGVKAEVIGITPSIRKEKYGDERGCEIKEWTVRNSFDGQFVIFDDDADMLPEQKENNFVQTDQWCGLTEADIAKAKELLVKQGYGK